LTDVVTAEEAEDTAQLGGVAEPHTPGPEDSHGIHSGHHTNTGISNEKLAMWLFLGSECLLFGGLISTYLLYKNRPGALIFKDASEGARAGSPVRISELFDIPFTSVSSFVLLASSLTMVFAVTAAARNEQSRLRLWLGATAGLRAGFIGGPGYEFANEYPTNQYGTDDPALGKPVLYPRGALAMANAGPDTNGSQFFLVYKDSKLPPNYTVFGTIDSTGLATLDKIAKGGVAGGGQDGKPATAVTVKSVLLD